MVSLAGVGTNDGHVVFFVVKPTVCKRAPAVAVVAVVPAASIYKNAGYHWFYLNKNDMTIVCAHARQ